MSCSGLAGDESRIRQRRLRVSAVGNPVIHYSAAPEPPIPSLSLSEHVLGTAAGRGAAPAIIDGQTGAVTSYEQLARNVKSLAAGLAGAGAGAGTVLALMSPNLPEYPQVLYAAIATGATVSPIGVLATEEDVARQLSDSGARILVVAESLRDTAIAAAAAAGVEGVYVIGEPGEARSLSELYGDPADFPRPHIDPATDVAALPYSRARRPLEGRRAHPPQPRRERRADDGARAQLRGRDDQRRAAVLPHLRHASDHEHEPRRRRDDRDMPRFDLEQFLELHEKHGITRAYVAPPDRGRARQAAMVDGYDLSPSRNSSRARRRSPPSSPPKPANAWASRSCRATG